MADFLVVLSSPAASGEAQERFLLGLALAQELQSQQPASVKSGPGFLAAGFARRDGSGGRVAVDPATGCWAVAGGSWFHSHGFASGSEQRLIERWQDAGIDAVARELDGFFTVVLGDPRTGDAFVITDAPGAHFVFQRKGRSFVAIGSSSLVLAGMGSGEPDPIGIQEIIRTGSAYEGRTAHKNVTRLAGGRIHRYRAGRALPSSVHWSPANVPHDVLSGDSAADALHAGIVSVAKKIHSLEPKILADLTGGYDSRMMLAGFLAAGITPATTVSGAPDSEDVTTAAEISALTGTKHHYVPGKQPQTFDDIARVMSFTDGEYDAVEYAPVLSIHAAHAHEYGISAAGSAGEMARGRWWSFLMPNVGKKGPMDARALAKTKFKDNRSDPSIFPASSRLDIIEHSLGAIARETEGLSHLPNTTQADMVFLSMRMSAWQGRIASSTDRLRRCVSPFLFRSLLDTCLSMTVSARYRSRVVREMLYRHAPQLAKIPLNRGYPPMPFRPSTAWAFRAMPAWYGKRAAAKALRMMGFGVSVAPSAGFFASPRLALWKDERVREQLDPRSMKLASLFESSRLESFLAESQRPSFAHEGGWNRLLTLEATMRRLEAARRNVRPGRDLPKTGFDERAGGERGAGARREAEGRPSAIDVMHADGGAPTTDAR